MTPFSRPIKQGLVLFMFCCFILVLGAGIYSTRWVFFSLLVGLGFGVILTPVIDRLSNRWHLPKPLSVIAVVVGTFGTFGAFGYMSYRLLSEQFETLASHWPEALQRVTAFVDKHPWLHNAYDPSRIGSTATDAAQTIVRTVASSIGTLGGLFFIFVVAVYLAVNPEEYFAGMLSAFPLYQRQRTRAVLKECAVVLRKWFVAQLIAMVIVGFVSAIGLKIIGSNFWLILGVLTAALELISFLGPLIAFFTAALVTAASQPDKAVWVMVLYFVILRLEGDIVIPMVMKGRVKLSPILLLTLMLILGEWFGVLGLFASAPLLAVLRTLYVMIYEPLINQKATENISEKIPNKKAA